jgi:hypothetical protein
VSWVKVDDHANEHRKQIAAGAEACWLWACGLMYCNRQSKRDGFIPAAVVPVLYASLTPRQARALVERLVDVGLWVRLDGGFSVHNYHKYQPTSDAAAELREKRKYAGSLGGKAKAAAAVSSNPSSKVPDGAGSEILPRPVPVPSRPVPKGENPLTPQGAPNGFRRAHSQMDDGCGGIAVDSWRDGIRSVTSKLPTLDRGQTCHLVDILNDNCPPGVDKAAWARDDAATYARAMKGFPLSVKGYGNWITGNRETGGAARRDVPQPGQPIGQGAWRPRPPEGGNGGVERPDR